MSQYTFWLEPIRTNDKPTFLKAITEDSKVRPVVGDEFTVPPSRVMYRIVRVIPVGNPDTGQVSYFSVVVGSRSDRLRTLTGMDAKGL